MLRSFRAPLAVLFVLALVVGVLQQVGTAQRQANLKKAFTYDQAFGGMPRPGEAPLPAQITGQLPIVTGWADDDHYLETRVDPADKERRVFSVSVTDGSATLYRDTSDLQKSLPSGFMLQAAVATTPDNTGFLFNRNNDLHFFDATTKRMRQLTATPAPERTPRLSPNGKLVAYTRENNLFVYDLQNDLERQLTTDGSDVILNGYASWVYMEEILGRASAYAAFWWSPDSTRLAYLRFDDSPVPIFPIYHAGREPYADPAWQHGTLEQERYPKAGDPNPYVQMGIVSVSDGKTVWMDFDPKADHYLAWPFWTLDSKTLTVQWMNREQDTIRFYNCDPATGRKTQIFEQKQPTWVTWFEDVQYLKNGGMLVRSDIDGWDHLYLYGNDGKLRTRLTSGPFRVMAIQNVDEKNGYVYFNARPTKPWDSHLMRVRLDGTGMEQLTRGDGTHNARVSPGGKYFIDTVSTITRAPVMNLCRIDGTVVKKLGDAWTEKSADYAWGKAELFTIKSADGKFDLPAYWILPPGFDPKDARKQYPVIFSIYGGPDAGTVANSWQGLRPHYWAQRGVITISVDHRGGGAFGREGLNYLHRSLGKWEMTDLITATGWLRSKPFIAKDKIAITGSSYGGYTTMMALFCGAGEFNYGQAGSSVTAWELYDSVYTERYMDTPKENPEGYKASAVLTCKDRYRGGLKITHGTIDDNVHMQNSMQVIDYLTTANKPFEMTLYPESRHGISQRAHLARESHDYWVQTLLGGRMPQLVTDQPEAQKVKK
jgi:dipeptidyl-peptidase-4